MLTITAVMLMVSAALPTASAKLTIKEQFDDIIMDEDETALSEINLYDHFSSDNNQMYFSATTADSKVQVIIHDDGSVDFSAPDDWYGTEEIVFTASDGEQEASATVIVRVRPVNDSPSLFEPLPDLNFEEDDSIPAALDLNEYFQDIDSILDFSYSSDSIIVQISDEGQVDFSALKDWNGAEEVRFFASDGELLASDSVMVTVNPVNDAPRSKVNVASIGLNADESQKTLDLKAIFSDVDDEALTYEITGFRRVNCDIDSQNGRLILYAPEDWSGKEFLTLTARDPSGGSSSVQIVVIVTGGAGSSGQMFYLFGLILALVIAGVRLQVAGRKRPGKSPVKLGSYRHYKRS
jgi:hypothetical protein